MGRPSHHPDCALSLDGADGADMIAGYKAPKCTCRQLRRAQRDRTIQGRERRSASFISDGCTSIGNGNYIRLPLKPQGY